MELHIPNDLAKELTEQANVLGAAPEQIALTAIRRTLQSDKNLEELLAPVRKRFQESGMTDDELSDLLEEEKHAMRKESSELKNQ